MEHDVALGKSHKRVGDERRITEFASDANTDYAYF